MKNSMFVLLVALAVSGCTATATTNIRNSVYSQPNTYGLKSYDPCIRCGEGWIFLNLDDTQHLKEQ